MVSEELAWAAGLFEGEGSICGRLLHQRYLYSQMAVTMCDEEPVRRFHRAVEVGNVSGPHGASDGKWSPRWTWSAGTRDDVESVFRALEPWLSARRKAQGEKALREDQRESGRMLAAHAETQRVELATMCDAGLTNAEIGKRLGIPRTTAQMRVSRLRKLGYLVGRSFGRVAEVDPHPPA